MQARKKTVLRLSTRLILEIHITSARWRQIKHTGPYSSCRCCQVEMFPHFSPFHFSFCSQVSFFRMNITLTGTSSYQMVGFYQFWVVFVYQSRQDGTVRESKAGHCVHNQVGTVTQFCGALETQVWQGYLSLQMGVGALVESMRGAGRHQTKVLSNWRETYYT